MEIFRLFGSIFIENEKANKSLKDTDQQAEKVGKTLQSTIKTASKWGQEMGKQLTTVGTNISKKAGVPLAALTALMGGLAKTTADYTATVKDNAVVVGLTTQAYQELNYAMQQSGLSQDDFVRMMGRVNQRVGMARQGNQKYRKSLEEMGLSLEAVDAGLVTTDEAFMAMIEHLHGLDDGQEQAALAGEFFGTMLSRRMMPLIKDGAQSVEELRQRAHDLGLVMDDLAVAKGDLLSDTLDDLSFTAKGLGRIFGSEMHAPMINIANAITDVISRFSAWLTENPKVVRQIIIWGGAIAGVLGVLVTLGTTLVITGKIIGALGAVFNILTSKPLLIIAAIGALYLAWESDWLGIRTAVEDAWAIISPVIDAIIEWGHQTISTVWNWTTETASKFLTWVQETAWPWIGDTVSTTWDWTTGKVGEFIAWIKDTAWPWIGGTVSTAWDWTKGTVADFITWIYETASPWIGKAVSTAWNWTLDVSGKWFDAIKKGFDTGDWSDFWDITEDLWSTGVVLAITLSSAVQGISAVIGAIQSGLGLVAATGASLGLPGLIGALSVGIQLMEAQAEGSYADFAKNVIAAGLIAAFLYPVTGHGGALAGFNLALNLKVGEGAFEGFKVLFEWIGHNLKSLFTGRWGEFISLDEFIQQAAQEKALASISENYAENLQKAVDELKIYPEDLWEDYAGMFADIWDVDENEIRDALGLEQVAKDVEALQQGLEIPQTYVLQSGETLIDVWEKFFKDIYPDVKDFGKAIQAMNPDDPTPFAHYEGKEVMMPLLEDAVQLKDELKDIDDLLDAIYRAEGGAKARVPYGMTGFADAGNKFSNERNQALFEELAKGLEEGSEEYYRAAVSVSVQHYWNTFQQKFPEVAGKTFEQLEPEMQQLFVLHMGRGFAPPSASEKNINWVPNVLSILGHEDAAVEFRAGSQELLSAWIEGVYDMASDAEAAAAYIAGIFADYLVGESPPPLGPLSVIDEGGASVMGAWVEGAEKGIKDGVPALTSGLEKVKGLFASIWDKVPEEIRGPIEQAMTWMTDLIGQAEEALFKLDDFQAELDALMGGGASPEEQAKGFMARLAAGLNEKLDQLDEPMNRLVDAVYTAGATLFEFGKTIASGNWLDAFLIILMETESFAKAMELLGKVMKPIVALFDIILRPIIEGLLKLWNGIIDALVSINIFGWQPFKGLAKHRIEDDPGDDGGSGRGSSSGRQVSEITGPTRDLLVDLLSPLANFGQIVAPIQDIRNILYERLPNFDAFGMDFAGAGAIGGDIIFEPGSIVINSSGTSATELSRDMLDAIEREMARRVNFGIRGRGGR